MKVKSTDEAAAWAKGIGALSVKVVCVDGRETELALPPKQRYRMKRFSEALAGFPWFRLEALDSRGKVLGWCENAEVDDEVREDAVSDTTAEVNQLTSIMLRAQDVALRRQAEHTHELLSASVELLRVYGQLLSTQQQTIAQLQAARWRDMERMGAGGGDLGEQLLMTVLPGAMNGAGLTEDKMEEVLGKVAAKFAAGGFPAAPKNGEPGKKG